MMASGRPVSGGPAVDGPAVDGPAVDAMLMRRTMGRFATGVAVVTTEVAGTPHGMTVNSLASVSLRPPLLLVCLTAGARSTDAVLAAGRFAVSLLSARQEHLALRFARRGEDHFAGLALAYEGHRVPVVPGAVAHLECELYQHLTAGDHVVVIGQVVRGRERDGEPLGFLSGRFGDFVVRGSEPEHWFG